MRKKSSSTTTPGLQDLALLFGMQPRHSRPQVHIVHQGDEVLLLNDGDYEANVREFVQSFAEPATT